MYLWILTPLCPYVVSMRPHGSANVTTHARHDPCIVTPVASTLCYNVHTIANDYVVNCDATRGDVRGAGCAAPTACWMTYHLCTVNLKATAVQC